MSQSKSFKSVFDNVKAPAAKAALSTTVPVAVVKEVTPKIWRVSEAEIEELVSESVPLFLERFPRLDIFRAAGYIRAGISDNSCRIMRTESAWYMARVDRSFFEPLPIVHEIFMCSFRKNINDIVWLANDMVSWGIAIKAAEVRIGSATDYDIAPLAKRIGATRKQTTYVKVLGG